MIFMKSLVIYLIFALAAVGTIGSAMALITHADIVKVTEELQVERATGPSAITVQNSGFSNAIKFSDIDNPQIYQFRQIGTGDRLDILDITNNRLGISMLASNGNIGIFNGNPTEKLDVNGNIKLSGNILSNGDICIGTCP